MEQRDWRLLTGVTQATCEERKIQIRTATPIQLRQDPPGQYDIAVLMNVLHELSISELAAALADIRRGLKAEGHLLLVDMCLLPEGEPRATPYYLNDLEELFGKLHDFGYTSKSGIPVIATVIPQNEIPVYADAKALGRRILDRKRMEWAKLAVRPELNPAVIQEMIGKGDEVFKLGFLSVLVASATARLDEDEVVVASEAVDSAAIAIIEHFRDVFLREARNVVVTELYERLVSQHSYEAIAKALEILTDVRIGWFAPFVHGAESRVIPFERFEWFEDQYGLAEIRKNGLVAMAWATADDWERSFE